MKGMSAFSISLMYHDSITAIKETGSCEHILESAPFERNIRVLEMLETNGYYESFTDTQKYMYGSKQAKEFLASITWWAPAGTSRIQVYPNILAGLHREVSIAYRQIDNTFYMDFETMPLGDCHVNA